MRTILISDLFYQEKILGIFDYLSNKEKIIAKADIDDSISEVLTRMSKNNIGCMIITVKGKLTGIFTERDLLKNWIDIYPKIFAQGKIKEVMTPNPIAIEKSKIDKASIFMTANKFRHLPIIENGDLVDILSIRDVLHLLMDDNDQLREQLSRLQDKSS